MELNRFLGILRRGWVLIVAFSLVGLLGAGLAALVTPTQYAASTRLFVTIQTTANASAGDLVAGNSFAVQKVTSYVAVATSPLVLGPVIDDLGLDTSPAELARDVTVTVAPNSAIIEISALADTPAGSADLTTAIASSFADVVVNEIEAPADGSPSPLRVQVIQPAVEPSDAALPSVPLFLAVGLVVGLALGLALVLLLGYLDRRVRTRADISDVSDHPILGSIPTHAEIKRGRLSFSDTSTGAASEAFRVLRTNLQFAGFEGRARSIVVASATTGEGTSTVVADLAVALADAGSSVVVVDADLRSPSIGTLFGLTAGHGLSEVITGRAQLDEVLVASGSGVTVLQAGATPPNPTELLGSLTMNQLLSALTSSFDYVLIDSPALLPVTDGAVLSRMTSGTILVVGARQVRRDQFAAAIDVIDQAGGTTIGVVANRVASRGADSDVVTRESGRGSRRLRRASPAKNSASDGASSPDDAQGRRAGTGSQRART